MSWGNFWYLGLLPTVLLLAGIVAAAGFRHRRALGRLFKGEMFERVLPTSVRVRRTFRDLFALAALALAVVALAEPRFDKQIHTVKAKGVDIVLVVDLSLSMLADDVDPSRLERVRREINDLVDILEGDRIGVVIYAGGAYPRMPLSHDYNAVKTVVDEFDVRMFEKQGTALGAAIRTAGVLLEGDGRGAGKAIWILSDGEIHRPDDAIAASKEVAERHIAVYAQGVGSQASKVLLPNGQYLRNNGNYVISTPSAEVLREVARVSGGAYVQSVASDRDVKQLYRSEIRQKLKAVETGSSQHETWRSAFQYPLGLSVLLFLGAAWIGDGRRPWGQAMAVFLAVSLASSPAMAGSLVEGDQLYRQGRFDEAVEVFTDLSLEQPNNPEVFERLGAARYRAGDYDGAARAYSEQLRLSNDLQARFNRGNSRYQAGRLDEALDDYDAVLEGEPDHQGAQHNRNLLAKELEARRAPPPPPPPKPGGGDQDEQEGGEGDQNPDPGDSSQQDQTSEGQGQDGDPESDQTGDQSGTGSAEEGEGSDQPGDAGQDGEGEPGGQQQGGEGEGEESSSEQAGDQSGGEGDDPNASSTGDHSTGAGEAGPMTQQQADRLLEGVQEGRPRAPISGGDEDKPW